MSKSLYFIFVFGLLFCQSVYAEKIYRCGNVYTNLPTREEEKNCVRINVRPSEKVDKQRPIDKPSYNMEAAGQCLGLQIGLLNNSNGGELIGLTQISKNIYSTYIEKLNKLEPIFVKEGLHKSAPQPPRALSDDETNKPRYHRI